MATRISSQLLFAGHAVRRQNFHGLLKALAGLPPDITLLVAGVFERNMALMTRSLGLDGRVGWTESATPADYQDSLFCVFPQMQEPSGAGLIRSLDMGCTPLAIRGSGAADEILRGTPYLLPPDPVGLAAGILNSVAMPPERARARALAAARGRG